MSELPTTQVTFAEPGFNQNPFPVFEEIRAAGPVVYAERLDRYLVTSYANCARVLKDVEHFNSQGSLDFFTDLFGGPTMETEDDPERHAQVRGVWARDFRRDTLERHARLITEIVDRQLGPFVERVKSGETVDAVTGMTRAIPTLVIAELLGIPPDMHPQFARWSDEMGAISQGLMDGDEEVVERGRAATRALNEFIAGELEERRRRGRDDLLTKMVSSSFAREGMSEAERIANSTQLVFAGNETTAKLMASTVVALGEHPDQRRLLARDRSLVQRAFEEVHRCQTLSQTLPRHACSDESYIGDVHIPNGAEVMPLLGAANRDPERWENPGRFEITRPPRAHLGFGFGMHTCLGIHLARLEVEIWLNRLLDELPDWELAGPIDYGTNFIVRGPLAVPVAAS